MNRRLFLIFAAFLAAGTILFLHASLGGTQTAFAKPIPMVCSIPTPGYGAGTATDPNARLNTTPHGSTLSCSAVIGEPLPETTVVITGATLGTPCLALAMVTYDWEVKISSNGRVTFKCYF